MTDRERLLAAVLGLVALLSLPIWIVLGIDHAALYHLQEGDPAERVGAALSVWKASAGAALMTVLTVGGLGLAVEAGWRAVRRLVRRD